MKKGLIVLLPGIRYSCDCPLLYYTRLSYEYAGYECIAIDDYGVESKGHGEDLEVFADLAVKNLIIRLKDTDFAEYEKVVFAEKSVGTVIGMALEDELKIENVYHIVYTPLNQTITYITPERRILGMAVGTEDKHIEQKVISSTCKKLGVSLVTVKGGGHRLEGGKDVGKDISALVQAVTMIGDPALVDKLDKKIADEKAKAEKAAKDKEEAEKAKAEAAEVAAKMKAKSAQKKEAAKKAKEEKEKQEKEATSKETKNGTNQVKMRPVKPTNVRKYIPRDAEEVMEIWLLSNVKEQSFIPKKYWNKNFTEIKRVIGIASVYVYEEAGKIVGFIASMENVMVGIYVEEDYRDHGVGKVLLDKLKADMGGLEASVYTKNKRALDFFGREKFEGKTFMVDQATGEEQVLLEW